MQWLRALAIYVVVVFALLEILRLFVSRTIENRTYVLLMVVVAVVVVVRHRNLTRARKRAEKLAADQEASAALKSHFTSAKNTSSEPQQASSTGINPPGASNSRSRLPRLELVYTNTRDMTHRRLVAPYRAGANMDYFDAWCFMEDVRRSFAFYRVKHAVNTDTGEVLTQAALYRLIHPKRQAPSWLKDSIE
jgi:hypothetical protein